MSSRAGCTKSVALLIAAVPCCVSQPEQVTAVTAVPAPITTRGVEHRRQDARGAAPVRSPIVSAALGQVHAVRGLAPRAAIDTRWVTRSELVDHLRGLLRTEAAMRMAAAHEALLFGLNVVSDDFDLGSELVEFLSHHLAGLYDPQAKRLYVATDLGVCQTDSAVEHELVHALQDQHFAIDDRLLPAADASDRIGALQSLAEGDATCVTRHPACAPGSTWGSDLPELAQPEQGHDLPSVLRRSAMAPYVDGVELVRWLLSRGGWELVNAVWRHPPETTEQLLHPDKLLAREPAEFVPVPVPPPDPGLTALVQRDVVGEQSLRVLLAEWLSPAEAANRAAGWGGDRLAVYHSGQRFAVAWHIRYDTVAGATQGFLALRGVGSRVDFEERVPDQSHRSVEPWSSTTDSCCWERRRRGPVALVRDARDIAVTVGPFVRNTRPSQSEGNCKTALGWAQMVAGQK